MDHELLILFKGFREKSLPNSHQELLGSLNCGKIFLDDEGLDISVYLEATRHVNATYLCFLNSFSVILEPDWLHMMYKNVVQPHVGLVGATGSWESHYNTHTALLGSPAFGASSLRSSVRCMIGYQARQHELRGWKRAFAPFPNPHIRTNAFVISRELMLSVKQGKIRSKTDALKFESGRYSLTQQVLAKGLCCLVVGRDGNAYEKEHWFQSKTFRSGNQENLLVADNQTKRYELADSAERRMLSEYAWGNKLATSR